MRRTQLYLSLLLPLAGFASAANAGELRSLVRLPADAYGAQPSYDSNVGAKSLSNDGTRVAFTSFADNLVAGGGGTQVYLADRTASTLDMLSRGADGLRGNGASSSPALSADGTHATWVSAASNLVAGDTPDSSDVFVQRTGDGARVRFSPPVEITASHVRVARSPRLSADGRRVVFGVASGTGPIYALYVGDTETGSLARLTPALVADQPEFTVGAFAISGDGATVVYGFGYPAAAEPPFTRFGMYAQDVASGARELVSRGPDGTPVSSAPTALDVSNDARYVAFLTATAAFVSGDMNGLSDVVVRDRAGGDNRLASFQPDGTQLRYSVRAFALDGSGANVVYSVGSSGGIYRADAASASYLFETGTATPVAIDGQGGIAFDSLEPVFVTGDTNRRRDVFVRGAAGDVSRASLSTTGPWPTSPCCLTSFVASHSARWLALGGMRFDLAVDSWWAAVGREGPVHAAVALPATWGVVSEPRSIDDSGGILTYLPGTAPGTIDIDPPPPPGTFPPGTLVFDRTSADELDVALTAAGGYPNGGSGLSRVSGDGRFVVFQSQATDLVPGANPLAVTQVFRKDLVTGELRLVSSTASAVGGNDDSFAGMVSNNGRFVTYSSEASDLVVGDGNGGTDAFVWDASTGTSERFNVTAAGGEVFGGSPGSLSICDDGSRLAWTDGAFGLVPGGSTTVRQAYVRDRVAGTTWRASEGPGGTAGNADSSSARLSGDCSTLAFVSAATNFGWNVPTGITQAWVGRVGASGRLELASRDRFDVPGTQSSSYPAISPDGSEVLFLSATGTWTLDGEQTTGVNVFARTRDPGAIFANGFED